MIVYKFKKNISVITLFLTIDSNNGLYYLVFIGTICWTERDTWTLNLKTDTFSKKRSNI